MSIVVRGALRAGAAGRPVVVRRGAVVSWRLWAVAGMVVAAAAGCGGSSSSAGHGSTTTPAPSTTARPTTVPSTTATSSTGPATTSQTVTVTPDTGLTSPQSVLVKASGFSPNEPLVVTECADKGNATGPGDCDLPQAQNVTSDANGQVEVHVTVTKGPFGANKIVCGAQPCLVSVTQASLSPTEEADQRITFG